MYKNIFLGKEIVRDGKEKSYINIVTTNFFVPAKDNDSRLGEIFDNLCFAPDDVDNDCSSGLEDNSCEGM